MFISEDTVNSLFLQFQRLTNYTSYPTQLFGLPCNSTVMDRYLPGIAKAWGRNQSCRYVVRSEQPLNMSFAAGDIYFPPVSFNISVYFQQEKEDLLFKMGIDNIICGFNATSNRADNFLFFYELKNYNVTSVTLLNNSKMDVFTFNGTKFTNNLNGIFKDEVRNAIAT